MDKFVKAAAEMDRPEVLRRLFFPRREMPEETESGSGMSHMIDVAPGISIGCRFYAARKEGVSILYFHGNGEIAADYDYVAPVYQARGINLFVADYRGYGASNGEPSCSTLIADGGPTFEGFAAFLRGLAHNGPLLVMGRSLGSAAAIHVAYRHQEQLAGLIVESGFGSQQNQLARLGVRDLFEEPHEVVGFGNDIKIKEVRIPTLIIHGEKDELIPVAEGKALLALSGATLKKSLFVPGAGHNDLMDRALDLYMEAISSFIEGLP